MIKTLLSKSFRIAALLAIPLFAGSCTRNKPLELAITPLPIEARVQGDLLTGPSVLNDPDRFVWGGSVVKGKDERYYMLYNVFESGDSLPAFTNNWVLHSEIALASSDRPDGDFRFEKIVLRGRAAEGDSLAWDAQMVSNPHIKRFGDTFYLYYIGSKDPGIQPEGSPGASLNKRNRVQQSQKIGVVSFSSFEELSQGLYTRSEQPLLSPRTRVKPDNIIDPSPEGTTPLPDNIIVVNPSVVQRPSDGKFLLYFKGNLYDPHWKGIHGVALSDAPDGPFKPMDQPVFDLRMEDGSTASAEDPYVWYHRGHEKFYAVFKDFTGKFTNSEPGLAIMTSDEGLTWKTTGQPLLSLKQVVLSSGDTIALNRLERPQLHCDAEGQPEVLYCAASIVNINPRTDGSSFNIQIPLKAEHHIQPTNNNPTNE